MCVFVVFFLSGALRRCLSSSYNVWRQTAHQHHAGDHQAEHCETHPGLRTALPERYDTQGRSAGGLRYTISGEIDCRAKGSAQRHVIEHIERDEMQKRENAAFNHDTQNTRLTHSLNSPSQYAPVSRSSSAAS